MTPISCKRSYFLFFWSVFLCQTVNTLVLCPMNLPLLDWYDGMKFLKKSMSLHSNKNAVGQEKKTTSRKELMFKRSLPVKKNLLSKLKRKLSKYDSCRTIVIYKTNLMFVSKISKTLMRLAVVWYTCRSEKFRPYWRALIRLVMHKSVKRAF